MPIGGVKGRRPHLDGRVYRRPIHGQTPQAWIGFLMVRWISKGIKVKEVISVNEMRYKLRCLGKGRFDVRRLPAESFQLPKHQGDDMQGLRASVRAVRQHGNSRGIHPTREMRRRSLRQALADGMFEYLADHLARAIDPISTRVE